MLKAKLNVLTVVRKEWAMSKFKKKSKSEIITTIIYGSLIAVMVICLIIKVWVVVEFADVPLSDIPAWALPWLGVTG